MIKINGIDHINMFVSNLERSLSFYQDLFGFQVKERGVYRDRPYAIAGSSGTALLAMYELPELPEQGRINHIGYNVRNFEALLEYIKKNGIETFYGAKDADGAVVYDKSRSVYIMDPDGNEIELSERFGGGL